MALTLSEDAKNEFLEEIGHDYVSKIWATVVICTSKILNYATKSKQKRIQQLNTYAYVGLTKDRLNIVTLSSLNVTSPTGYFSYFSNCHNSLLFFEFDVVFDNQVKQRDRSIFHLVQNSLQFA